MTSELSERVPATMTIGILMLQSMRLGFSSVTPPIDGGGNTGWAPYQIYACLIGLAAAVSLFLENAATTTVRVISLSLV